MARNDWTFALGALLIPVVFVSIFEYRIAGSNPTAVLVGGLFLSVSIVAVGYESLNRGFGDRPDVNVGLVAVGATLVSAVILGTYFGLSAAEYGELTPLLTVIGAVVMVTFWVGNKTAGDPVDGLLHGFLTGGTSGVVSMLLVSYEAVTREVVFNALVAITSVGIPLTLAALGAISGLLGGSFARRRSETRTTQEL